MGLKKSQMMQYPAYAWILGYENHQESEQVEREVNGLRVGLQLAHGDTR